MNFIDFFMGVLVGIMISLIFAWFSKLRSLSKEMTEDKIKGGGEDLK